MPREELSFPQSDSQTKERKVPPKASKVTLRFFSIPGSFTFIPKDVFFLGVGLRPTRQKIESSVLYEAQLRYVYSS